MKDTSTYIKSGAGIWSDNETDRKGNAQEQLPAESDFFRPDRFLLEDEPEKGNKKNPVDVTACPHKLQCLADTLRLFRNRFKNDRDFLIWIARYFLRLKLNVMEEIFRFDSTTLWRISTKADESLRRRG